MSNPYTPPPSPPGPVPDGRPADVPGHDPAAGPYGSGSYPGATQQGWNQPEKASGLTVAALVVGIVAVVFGVIPAIGFLSFLLGPVAIILGVVALVKKRPKKGFAIAGMVTGAVGLIAAIVQAILAVFLVNTVSAAAGETAAYTYEATGESYVVSYMTTDLENVATEDVEGEFSAEVEASKLFGTLYAMNNPDVTGAISCRILDASGAVVAEQTASGPDADVECSVIGDLAP